MITKDDILAMGYPEESWFGDAVEFANHEDLSTEDSNFENVFNSIWQFFKDGGHIYGDESSLDSYLILTYDEASDIEEAQYHAGYYKGPMEFMDDGA